MLPRPSTVNGAAPKAASVPGGPTPGARRRAQRLIPYIFYTSLAAIAGVALYFTLSSPLPSAPSEHGLASRTGASAGLSSASGERLFGRRFPPLPPAPAADDSVTASSRRPPYPLLGRVLKVVSPEGAPPAFEGHGVTTTHPGVSCVVSDRYRFIYIIVHKAGSQTTRAYFLEALCGSRAAADAPNSNCTAPLLNFRDTGARYTPCKDVPRAKFASYYVFTHARNVWARAVSTYSFCRMQVAAGISWSSWCADPDTHRDCFRSGGADAAKVVARGGPPPVVRGTNEHWGPQLPRMCTPAGECWVDYVGRSESIGLHLNAVISDINGRRDEGLPALPKFVNRVLNARPGASPPSAWYAPRSALSAAEAAAADANGVQSAPSCRAAIGRYYADDVAAFGSKFEDMVSWGAVDGAATK